MTGNGTLEGCDIFGEYHAHVSPLQGSNRVLQVSPGFHPGLVCPALAGRFDLVTARTVRFAILDLVLNFFAVRAMQWTNE